MSGAGPAVAPTGLAYKSMSASALVKTGAGTLFLVVVASSTSGTIKIWDNTAGSGTVILDTMSVNAGEEYELPFQFNTGLYVTLAGTVNVTVGYV